MKIEKLTENQIRITLNVDDLIKNNINLHSFMSNSLESQDLFCLILDKAEKEIGFKTDNYKLMIEAISTPENNFILTITRLKQEQIEKKRKVQAKRKEFKINDNIFIYKFKSFDDLCGLVCYLRQYNPLILNYFKKSKLYKYNSNYYFIFNNTNFELDIPEIKKIHCMFLEFSEYISNYNSKLFERKLIEYGNLIISENAVKLINKYF
jgi:adapter protein MecA 1/2